MYVSYEIPPHLDKYLNHGRTRPIVYKILFHPGGEENMKMMPLDVDVHAIENATNRGNSSGPAIVQIPASVCQSCRTPPEKIIPYHEFQS